jgi:hypothetical protein
MRVELRYALIAGAPKKKPELVSSETSDHCSPVSSPEEAPGNGLKHFVSEAVTEAIVEYFEVIKVNHGNPEWAAAVATFLHCCMQFGDESAPIGETSKKIGFGRRQSFLTSLFSLPAFVADHRSGLNQRLKLPTVN